MSHDNFSGYATLFSGCPAVIFPVLYEVAAAPPGAARASSKGSSLILSAPAPLTIAVHFEFTSKVSSSITTFLGMTICARRALIFAMPNGDPI